MKNKKLQDLVFFLLILLVLIFFPKFGKYIPSKEVLSQVDVEEPSNIDVKPQNERVVKVIDGDTIEVFLNGKTEKIRIIGINAPETIDPRRPVECFGKEASAFAKSLLNGKVVTLEPDETQANKDRYSRLLRYVYLPNKTDFGLKMIKEGYAYEYTYDLPYTKQKEYKSAQKEAEQMMKGLWGNKSCSKNQ